MLDKLTTTILTGRRSDLPECTARCLGYDLTGEEILERAVGQAIQQLLERDEQETMYLPEYLIFKRYMTTVYNFLKQEGKLKEDIHVVLLEDNRGHPMSYLNCQEAFAGIFLRAQGIRLTEDFLQYDGVPEIPRMIRDNDVNAVLFVATESCYHDKEREIREVLTPMIENEGLIYENLMDFERNYIDTLRKAYVYYTSLAGRLRENRKQHLTK